MEVVDHLTVQLLAEGGERADGLGAWVAVEKQAAAGAFELLELAGERALVHAEGLGGLVEAGVLGEDDEAGETLAGVSSNEHGSQWFGDLGGVNAGEVEVGEPVGAGAAP